MKIHLPLSLSLALLSGGALAATDPDTVQLRSQIEQLQAQIRAMQAQCPAAVTPTVSALPSAAPVPTPMPATAGKSAAIPTPSPTAPAQPPPGYKLVKVDPNEEAPLPKDDRWREPSNWDALARNMSMSEVESILGVEHRVQKVKDRIQWTYGKVGPFPASRLIFVDGQLAVWEAPNF